MDTSIALIESSSFSLNSRDSEGWWLEITWSFQNKTEDSIYLLVGEPNEYLDSNPMIIDHSAQLLNSIISPFAPTPFSFQKIPPNEMVELLKFYALPPWDFNSKRQIIGRFGLSTDKPGSDWEKTDPPQLIIDWQQVLASKPFTVVAPSK